MKILFDFFPIIIFFIVYKLFGIYAATGAAIVASIIQVIYYRIQHGKFEHLQIATLALIILLGGATLIFHEVIFIKWKITIVNWLFAMIFLITQFFGKEPLIKSMMKKNIPLPDKIWCRLNLMWIIYFFVLGTANLYVIYHYTTDIWVDFKLFGVLTLTVLFALGQGLYLYKHMQKEGTQSHE